MFGNLEAQHVAARRRLLDVLQMHLGPLLVPVSVLEGAPMSTNAGGPALLTLIWLPGPDSNWRPVD
jgi:hypothetical protein